MHLCKLGFADLSEGALCAGLTNRARRFSYTRSTCQHTRRPTWLWFLAWRSSPSCRARPFVRVAALANDLNRRVSVVSKLKCILYLKTKPKITSVQGVLLTNGCECGGSIFCVSLCECLASEYQAKPSRFFLNRALSQSSLAWRRRFRLTQHNAGLMAAESSKSPEMGALTCDLIMVRNEARL